MTTKEIGDFGERAACRYLKKHGLKILCRNYRMRGGELDIVAQEGDVIVFVEVKTRKNRDFGNPCEFVSAAKQEKLIKTAYQFLGCDDAYMRFDIVEVLYTARFGIPSVTEINHIQNAF